MNNIVNKIRKNVFNNRSIIPILKINALKNNHKNDLKFYTKNSSSKSSTIQNDGSRIQNDGKIDLYKS